MNSGKNYQIVLTHQPSFEYTEYRPTTNVNHILNLAEPIFKYLISLKNSKKPYALEQQQLFLLKTLQAFQSKAKNMGYESDSIALSLYTLAALSDKIREDICVDEENQTSLKAHSLVHALKITAFDNERFLAMLSHICRHSKRFTDVIELVYRAWTLGFQTVLCERGLGQEQSDQIEDELYQIMRTVKGELQKTLSPEFKHLRTASPQRHHKKRKHYKTKIILLSLLTTAILFYFGFDYLLNVYSNPLKTQLKSISFVTKGNTA